MEGDFVARSSITKMIESTIGGNGNRVNGVIITNLEAISSRPDQSEDAPSFPPLDPSRAFHASNRIFHRLVFKSRNSSSFVHDGNAHQTITCNAAFAFLHFLSTAIYGVYIYIYTIVPLLQNRFSRGISRGLSDATRHVLPVTVPLIRSRMFAVCRAYLRYHAEFQSNLAKFQKFPKR